MIYIYNDYGGTHTTVLAAAFHLNKLPQNKTLTRKEILNVDYFNKLNRSDMGRIIFHGVDEEGDSVYTVGRGNSKAFVPGMKNLIEILQGKSGHREKIIFSNTSPTVPITMTLGGILSRGLGIDSLGVPLLIKGAKQASSTIVQLVQHTREMAQSSDEEVLILENTKKLLFSNA
jgi:hypothetical protein